MFKKVVFVVVKGGLASLAYVALTYVDGVGFVFV